MPGVYDVVCLRGPTVSAGVSWTHATEETYAYGHVALGQCVAIP